MAEVDETKVIGEPDGSSESEPSDRHMDVESPSSELENLASQQYAESDSGESMASGKEGTYEVNPEQHTPHKDEDKEIITLQTDENKENIKEVSKTKEDRRSIEPAEKKMKTEKGSPDGKMSDSRPGSVASSGGKSSTPGRERDPAKKEKDSYREEKIRQAQLKLAEDRQRKIEEMKEQQKAAQENREKQLEARRKKIEELKRREDERRKQVDERRRTQEEIDRAKKEAILNKAKERLTRYEQWKTHGRKGYPGESPPSKKLSMSMSVLYSKRSPDFSSSGTINKLGTGNFKSGAESLMALNTIPENRLRRSLPASAPPSRHKSAMNVSTSGVTGVKMRDPSKMSPRKQRPYSVATSMPSFVSVESDAKRPSRSKSTDRGIRDAGDTRTPGRKEETEKDKKAATLPRPYNRKKIEERRLEAEKKREERKEREKEREKERVERMSKSETHEKEKHPSAKPLSKSFIERMSAPKTPTEKKESAEKDAATTPVKTSTPKMRAKPQRESPAKSTPVITIDQVSDNEEKESDSTETQVSEPTVKFAEPEVPQTPPKVKSEPKQVSPEPKPAKAETSTPKTDKEREMEEYKNKLAERRRLAREKAERDAEIERIRQEELRRQEDERQREEEERQRREEEESIKFAEEARKAEEERLARAIEAEEKRKKDEAERLEKEKIQKEEADRKAKEEAEKMEKARQEKAKKEEVEKVERKKRLEEVLKRFKTDSPSSTPEKTRTESPPRLAMTESKVQDIDSPKLKVESEAPKFKSPLLQSIMGKTKLGARLSSTKLDEMGRSTEKLSSSTDQSSDDEKVSTDKEEEKEVDIPSVVNGHGHTEKEEIVTTNDTIEQKGETNITIEASEDTIEVRGDIEQEGERNIDNGHSPLGDRLDNVIDTTDTVTEGECGREPNTDSQITVGSSTADSAVSLSFNGVSSHNGDLHIDPKELIESKELVDSSISMRTADSFASSQTGSIGGSLVDSQNLPTSDSTQFEEVIDLNVHVTNKTLKAQQLAENLINHNLNDNDNITMSDSPTHSVSKPFIAFEDNATRRQDVTDLLS